MHLYLHVPFCVRRCSYCDFAIAVRRRVPATEFVDLILAEWRMALATGPWHSLGPIETVYFGGGTPSLVGADAIATILTAIRQDATISATAEVTIEANPEDVVPALAAGLARAGVNRVSLGVQSFNPDVLSWMHRVHGPAQPAAAVAALRDAGLSNISLDLIYGIPSSLQRDWAADLDEALALEPSHLSLYGLTVEDHTPLGRWVARGTAVPATDPTAAAEYLTAHDRLGAAGLGHYEVSNAARPGAESRHNRAYWRRAPYLGLGPSAHSSEGSRRWWNIREWAAYRRTLHGGGRTVAGEEDLSPDQVELEEVYLGLRTDQGRPASSLPIDLVSGWEAAGWAGRNGSQVVLTAEGWLRLDALVCQVAGA